MSRRRALITGITGQDGSYLAEYLLALDYEVHGIVRRVAIEDPDQYLWRLQPFHDRLNLHLCSLDSFPSLFQILTKVMPDECYHLAAQSFVSYSFEDEFSTMATNVNGTHNLLAAVHSIVPQCRFYFAGSSEMFGKVEAAPQNEKTHFCPRSIYGISKVAGFQLTRNYRESYQLHACSGILFNHESPRRGSEFVTRKITLAAAKIKLGLETALRLGNIEARRDWGFAGDFIKAMHAMLNYDVADDYVIATGETHSVRDLLSVAFGALGLDYEPYLQIDERLIRTPERVLLTGDASKASEILGWRPKMAFEELILSMVRADYDHCRQTLK